MRGGFENSITQHDTDEVFTEYVLENIFSGYGGFTGFSL